MFIIQREDTAMIFDDGGAFDMCLWVSIQVCKDVLPWGISLRIAEEEVGGCDSAGGV